MTNFTLTILVFLSLFTAPADELKDNVHFPEPIVVMESNLIITEIMYNPNSAENRWEWIEVYNSGLEPIDLSGYVLDDNNSSRQSAANILSGTIAPNSTAILFDSDITVEQFTEVWGDVNAIPVVGWPGLNNSGDSIGLWHDFESYDGDNAAQLNVIEQVIYENAGDWPGSSNAGSIFLIALDFDNTLGSNWSLSEDAIETPLGTASISQELHTNTGLDIGSPNPIAEEEDTTPPTIECSEMVEIDHDEGFCSSEIPLLLPEASDNVSTEITLNSERSDGLELEAPFPVGDTMITWSATDEANNTSLPCEQLVRVIETELPTAIAQNISIELDENGLATISPEELDNADTPSFDNCGIDVYLASRTEFNCSDLEAPVQVAFSVVDANGNTSAVTNVTVTVLDKLKPILICNSDIVTISSSGSPIFLEDVAEPLVTDNCDDEPQLSFSRSDQQELNAPFEVGTTTINWQAVDVMGNITMCTQTILVDFAASMDNDIIAFSIPTQVGETAIDASLKTIELLMPIGTDVTALIPSFLLSDSASSSPESEEAVDFTEPFAYRITAQDGSVQEWTITVTVEEDTVPPTFDVSGNTEDFITELEVGDVYIVGEILNIVDVRSTSSEILGDDLVDTSLEGGPFLVTYSVSDGINITAITETVLVAAPIQASPSILSFTLVNADTNEDIFILEEGMAINSADLPTMNLNIRANAAEDTMSVALSLSGDKTTTKTENVSPYALYGDAPAGNYNGREFGLGSYTVAATAFAENQLEGQFGEELSLSFQIIEVKRSADLIAATYLQGAANPSPTGPILRTEEGNRETYLKFNLSAFSGPISAAQLKMQVTSDPGFGTLEVYLGSDSNWTETGLNGANKPNKIGEAIASISGTHSLGETKIWDLDLSQISNDGLLTLIVSHSNGNDVAFASDETNNAPELSIISALSGRVDIDGDGFFSDVDCDDNNAAVHPDAIEICDGIDNNCDGLIDEADPEVTCTAAEVFLDLIDATYLQGAANPNPTGLILRTEEGVRETYLKFDVGELNGSISEVRLEMLVASDPGFGTIEVFLGSNSNWTETDLNGSNKPSPVGGAIGEITGTHRLGQTKIWTLDSNQFPSSGFVTLIVKHSNGNDVAFASDESNQPPQLIFTVDGMDETSGKRTNALSVSPNPASVQATLTFKEPTELAMVYFYDVLGRLMGSYSSEVIESNGAYVLDVQSMPAGTYYVKAFDDFGNVYQKQLLIKK